MLELLTLLERTLLFTGGERLLKLSVDEKVAKDAARAPGDAIGPALDARRVLFIDEDVSTLDKILTFAIVWSARHMVELTRESCLEEDEGING